MISDSEAIHGIEIGRGNVYEEKIHSIANPSTANPTWNRTQGAAMGNLANNCLSYSTT
jgi:hypothetical protein